MNIDYFLVILLSEILILFTYNIDGYSKVVKNGAENESMADTNDNSADATRLHRAREGATNVDLWFPSV